MLSTSVPPKFSIPWAANAGAANIRAIPVPSQITTQGGAASLTDGFPPLNFVPVAAGGIPPFGQDMNGILNQMTQWSRWQSAGGPVVYDPAFATAIGGYPKSATLMSNTGHAIYESVVESNLTDPNGGNSAGWRILSSTWSAQSWAAVGSANIQTINLSPTPINATQLIGIPIWIISSGTNTGATTVNPNGFGGIQVVTTGGGALPSGSLVSGFPYQVIFNGSVFLLNTPSSIFNDAGGGGVQIVGSSSSGAGLELVGNGVSTPKKWLRVSNGHFGVVNNAYTSEIMTLTDAGAVSFPGDITSQSGQIHAAVGGTGSSDLTVGTTMRDFNMSFLSNPASNGMDYIYQKLPSGYIIQSYGGMNATGADVIAFPNAFPNICVQITIIEGAPNGWLTAAGASSTNLAITQFGAQSLGASNFALYVGKWDISGKQWALSGGISYRYHAVGF